MNKTFNKGVHAIKVHDALDIEISKKKDELMQTDDPQKREVICDELKTLLELAQKETELRDSKKVKINWKDITQPAVSIASILLILNYEREDIITSKAFSIATRLFK